MADIVTCTTFNQSQAVQDAKLAALALTDAQQTAFIASLNSTIASLQAAAAAGVTKDAQQDTTIAALQLLVNSLGQGNGGGITAVTPAMVLTATQAMTPAQLAAMCAVLNCGVSSAQLTAALLAIPGMNVAGNVLTSTGSGLQGQAPVSLSTSIAALSDSPTPLVPGTTKIVGADGYKYVFPLLPTGGGGTTTPAATDTVLGTVTLNQVGSLAAAQVVPTLSSLPNGGQAVPGSTFLVGSNGQAYQLPAYPAGGGQSLANCSGILHTVGQRVPSCAEMSAAITAATGREYYQNISMTVEPCANVIGNAALLGTTILTSINAPVTLQIYDGNAWNDVSTIPVAQLQNNNGANVPGIFVALQTFPANYQAGLYRVRQPSPTGLGFVTSAPGYYNCTTAGGTDNGPGGNV